MMSAAGQGGTIQTFGSMDVIAQYCMVHKDGRYQHSEESIKHLSRCSRFHTESDNGSDQTAVKCSNHQTR